LIWQLKLINEQYRVKSLTEVINSLYSLNRTDEAVNLSQYTIEFTRQINSHFVQVKSLVRSAKFLERIGNTNNVIKIADYIDNVIKNTHNNDRINMLTEQVKVLALASRDEDAKCLIDKIEDKYLRVVILVELAELLIDINKVDHTVEIFHDLVETVRQIIEKEKRVDAIIKVVKILLLANQVDTAKDLIEIIPDRWTQATLMVYMVKSLALTKSVDKATIIAYKIPYELRQAEALVWVVKALLLTKRIGDATMLAQGIHDRWKQADALAEVVKTLVQAQKIEEATALAKEIPDELRRVQILVEVIKTLMLADRVDDAIKIIQEMNKLVQQLTDKMKRAEMLLAVVRAMVEVQQIVEADKLAHQITVEDQRVEALVVIASHLAQTMQWEAVIRVISEAAAIETRDNASIIHFISTLPHLPTVLTLVQRLWSQATRRDDLYALLPAAPLFVADPTLLPQILEGEEWVKEQLRW
jgi:hypothetical protein